MAKDMYKKNVSSHTIKLGIIHFCNSYPWSFATIQFYCRNRHGLSVQHQKKVIKPKALYEAECIQMNNINYLENREEKYNKNFKTNKKFKLQKNENLCNLQKNLTETETKNLNFYEYSWKMHN